jgi:hypothetical protein
VYYLENNQNDFWNCCDEIHTDETCHIIIDICTAAAFMSDDELKVFIGNDYISKEDLFDHFCNSGCEYSFPQYHFCSEETGIHPSSENPSADKPIDGKSELSGGAIAGIIVASVFVGACLGFIILNFCVLKRKNDELKFSKENPDQETKETS